MESRYYKHVHKTQMWHANRARTLKEITPPDAPVLSHFGHACFLMFRPVCPNITFPDLEFRTSLGTSILLIGIYGVTITIVGKLFCYSVFPCRRPAGDEDNNTEKFTGNTD